AMQHPALEYGEATNERTLKWIDDPTDVHLCFGYANTDRDKPSGNSYKPELERSRATHVSIEAAQPKLDCTILRALPSKIIVLGVLDLGDAKVESPEVVAGRIRAALAHVPPERLVPAPDCGMKYLPRERAVGKLEALAAGARIVRAELAAGRRPRPAP